MTCGHRLLIVLENEIQPMLYLRNRRMKPLLKTPLRDFHREDYLNKGLRILGQQKGRNTDENLKRNFKQNGEAAQRKMVPPSQSHHQERRLDSNGRVDLVHASTKDQKPVVADGEDSCWSHR